MDKFASQKVPIWWQKSMSKNLLTRNVYFPLKGACHANQDDGLSHYFMNFMRDYFRINFHL